MNVLDFFSAVSEGDLKKVKEFYANGGKVDLNHNLTYAMPPASISFYRR